MQDSYDVVIVGGGVIGSSVAYFLSANPAFAGTICVVERDSSYRTASSTLSTSAIRQQFATMANIAMSRFSIAFLRDVPDKLAIEGERPNIELKEPGYLILCGAEHRHAFIEKHNVQHAAGVKAKLLAAAELTQLFPWLRVEEDVLGSFGLADEGWFDGYALLQAFRKKAQSQKVRYVNANVTGMETSASGRIAAVTLEDGSRIACNIVVNAAGPYASTIAAMAGANLPVRPYKRCIFVFESPQKLANCPFVFDTTGVLMRPEGHVYICGTTPPHENDPNDYSLEVDYALFDDIIWPALAHRIPGFEQLRLLRAWAGHYEYNVFDHSAIIGKHPTIENLIFACGFSGHGMMHSPAAGLGVSELIASGRSRTIDLQPFGFERIAANRPIAEPVF